MRSSSTSSTSTRWHLDERPLRADNEINPDVVGYIFEKYINQKQMGAYYTKEDITEYICKNTIIPFLFDAAREEVRHRLQARQRPVAAASRRPRPLHLSGRPPRRDVRLRPDQPPGPQRCPTSLHRPCDDRGRREGRTKRDRLEQAAAGDPTPCRPKPGAKYVARRQRCLESARSCSKGEVHEINDLITLNLDIWQFARDAIVNAEGPELLRAFWQAIEKVTVLDPTCGSGAFLFAALRILETLYSDCLERMERFVEDLAGQAAPPRTVQRLQEGPAQIAKHPNERYFILKSIIINNLFGVDIMEEAVEICKLRLFLKLVAQVETVDQIEPLPDIDFNIRAGNTLVGFASLDQVTQVARRARSVSATGSASSGSRKTPSWSSGPFSSSAPSRPRTAARSRQGQAGTPQAPGQARRRTRPLPGRGIWRERWRSQKDFDAWKASHQPFHWFVEFYGIMHAGGFDVIIGNPPYVEYSEDRVGYRLLPDAFKTFECKNLYGYVFERSLALASRMAGAGLIVQLTAMSAEKMASLQDILLKRSLLICMPFPRRPESMFDGVEMPVVILLSLPNGTGLQTSRISRFYTEERPSAIPAIALQDHSSQVHGHRIAKLGSRVAVSALTKVLSLKNTLENITCKHSDYPLYYQEACRYWAKACKGYPHFKRNGKAMPPPHGRILTDGLRIRLCFRSELDELFALLLVVQYAVRLRTRERRFGSPTTHL